MRLRAYLSRLGRETKGIASLEFVLILFPMLFIFFGVIQISGIFYYYHQMQKRGAGHGAAHGDRPQLSSGNVRRANGAV